MSKKAQKNADRPSVSIKDWLSISAYARAYGIDRGTVYKFLEANLLIYYRVERLIRIKDQPPQHKPFRKRPSA